MLNRASNLYVIVVIAILAIATVVRFADPFFVQALRLIAFDSYQLLKPAEYDPNLPVRVVDIDEASLERVGQWPWSRLIMADLLEKLVDQGAAVVAFDILFSEPDRTSPEVALALLEDAEAAEIAPVIERMPRHDAEFAQAISARPTVLATILTEREAPPPPQKAGFAVAGDDPKPFIRPFLGSTSNLPELDAAASGIGSVNWVPDRDQVVRRLPLVYRIGDQYVPTLLTEALRVAQNAGTYVLKASNASGQEAFGQETGLNHIKVGAIEIPTDSDGAIWMQFRPSNSAAYIPAWKVLAGENDPNEIAGSIIFVGTSAPGLLDLRATPLDPSIAGVEVHAQAVEHILRGSTITRLDDAVGFELTAMILLGLLLAALLPRLSALASAAIGLATIGLVLGGGYLAYSVHGLLFDPSYTALVLFVLVIVIIVYVYRRSEQQKSEVRKAFGYYVSPEVVNEIVKHPGKLELGGEVRELSLLFCDVRNFTSISEKLSAHELTRFINTLLTPLSEIILANRGNDKHIGRRHHGFWNAPLDDKDHPENARSRRRHDPADGTSTCNAEGRAAGRTTPRSNGIGINSGNCCVGNLGSSQRFDYSAIGDDVNVASRLEGLSKVYGVPIVLGETTVGRLNGIKAIELDVMRVKGRAQPLRVYTAYEALGSDDSAFATLAPRHTAMLDRYRGRDWDGAEQAIAECEALGITGLGGLYAVYRGRIAEWRESPPPPDWDGTFTATTK